MESKSRTASVPSADAGEERASDERVSTSIPGQSGVGGDPCSPCRTSGPSRSISETPFLEVGPSPDAQLMRVGSKRWRQAFRGLRDVGVVGPFIGATISILD
jgi:hypothetical protein